MHKKKCCLSSKKTPKKAQQKIRIAVITQTQARKTRSSKRWRWVWSVSLLASISFPAGLTAMSPAFTSSRDCLPIGSTRHHSHTPPPHPERKRRGMTGRHHTLHIFILTHTRRVTCPIYTKRMNAERRQKKQTAMHIHTNANCPGPADVCVCVVY